MKIYLATWMLEKSQGKSLTKKRCRNRLMSFWHTKDQTIEDVKNYIKFGRT